MAIILIDYENITECAGLKGYQWLNKNDRVIVFYSEFKSKLRKNIFDHLKNYSEIECIKLKAKGKNGLDFYIASELGLLCGTDPKLQAVIVSNDKGFNAVIDFWNLERNTIQGRKIVLADSIETGLVQLDAPEDHKRRSEIHHSMTYVDLDTVIHTKADRAEVIPYMNKRHKTIEQLFLVWYNKSVKSLKFQGNRRVIGNEKTGS